MNAMVFSNIKIELMIVQVQDHKSELFSELLTQNQPNCIKKIRKSMFTVPLRLRNTKKRGFQNYFKSSGHYQNPNILTFKTLLLVNILERLNFKSDCLLPSIIIISQNQIGLKMESFLLQDNDSAQIVLQGFIHYNSESNQRLNIGRIHESSPTIDSFDFSHFLSLEGQKEFSNMGAGYQLESEELQLTEKVQETVEVSEIQNQLAVSTQYFQNAESNPQRELSKAHLAVLTRIRVPIFPMSRKINKTKKRNGHNNSFYSAIDKKMTGRRKGAGKRLDQQQHLAFGKLSPEEQEDRDQTFEDIRLLTASNDPESKAVLGAYQAKYLLSRPWALFLDDFVNSS